MVDPRIQELDQISELCPISFKTGIESCFESQITSLEERKLVNQNGRPNIWLNIPEPSKIGFKIGIWGRVVWWNSNQEKYDGNLK